VRRPWRRQTRIRSARCAGWRRGVRQIRVSTRSGSARRLFCRGLCNGLEGRLKQVLRSAPRTLQVLLGRQRRIATERRLTSAPPKTAKRYAMQ
jgi:hypothetical protein